MVTRTVTPKETVHILPTRVSEKMMEDYLREMGRIHGTGISHITYVVAQAFDPTSQDYSVPQCLAWHINKLLKDEWDLVGAVGEGLMFAKFNALRGGRRWNTSR